METGQFAKRTTRREMLRATAAFAGGAVLTRFIPEPWVARAATWVPPQEAAAPADQLAAFRAQMASAPLVAEELAENLTLLSGPGGNVVVLDGADGKILVDTFVSPAWLKLRESLDGLGKSPLKLVINTHWHFDHTDNNAELSAAGATVLAHENTRKRMGESHELLPLGLKIPASPPAALPQKTFKTTHEVQAKGETLALAYVPPAHTDTDIYIHFQKADVLHLGDLFFKGMYPFIDGSTGGNISGMIAAADRILGIAGNHTKIVPGHGPLGNKADLVKFREMLSTARERVGKLKSSGKSPEEAAAAKPLADLELEWGGGFLNSDVFVQVVYGTL